MLLHKRSKKVPIISCWSALADKCIHTAIFRFINQVHEQDYIHWYSYSTLGITCVENRKTDSPIGGQGLRMTVIFQMRNNNHQLGQKSKGNTTNEVILYYITNILTYSVITRCFNDILGSRDSTNQTE